MSNDFTSGIASSLEFLPEGRKLLTGKKLHQFLIQQRLKHFINDAMHTNKTVIQHFAANTRQIMIWLSKLCRCMI